MTSFQLLPPVPRPPHDPLTLTLDESRGWHPRELDDVIIEPRRGALTLDVTAAGRALDEPSGSFGGLVPPSLVAVGEGCDVWLVDRKRLTLLKLDECKCRFIDVPCFGEKGSGIRQLEDVRSVAWSRGNLFVVDTGNARVVVLSVRGYLVRGFIAPPAGEITNPWQPVALAADPRGRVYVADPANGAVHRFAAHGTWETAIRNLGDVRHLAVDCAGRLYVLGSTSATARVFDASGAELEPAASVAALRGWFAPMPFRVDRDGALDFSCSAGPCCRAFGPDGAALPSGAKPDAPLHATDGFYRSDALDSGIAECQWHRVIVCGELPAGTTVTVLTWSSEVPEPDELVAALPDEAWETRQVARRAKDSTERCTRWDCLVRSGPGRYLWLKLRLRGDGRSTPRIDRVDLELPRISLARYLPGVYGEDPGAGEFTDRFLAIFDTTVRSIERQLDRQAALFDPRSTPATPSAKGTPDFLSWLASWVGIQLDRHWPEARRRRFLRDAPKLFDRRGTLRGLRDVLHLYLGLADRPERRARPIASWPGAAEPARCHFPSRCAPHCDPCAEPERCEPPCLPKLVLEHWRLRRWLFVGGAKLGEQSMLWGKGIVNRSRLDDGAHADATQLISAQDPYRDPFHVYAHTFTVFVPACYGRDETARKGLENLLRDESPAHTRWHLELVEPRFRIGVQSMIGYDSVVGRYPVERVTVGESALCRSTILGAAPGESAGPTMRVGRTARIGSSTLLK